MSRRFNDFIDTAVRLRETVPPPPPPEGPISRVPCDILKVIFEWCHSNNLRPVDLALTSRRWCNVVYGTPRLWSKIWIRPSGHASSGAYHLCTTIVHLRFVLRKSGVIPLSVRALLPKRELHYTFGPCFAMVPKRRYHETFAPLFALLCAESSRWISVELEFGQANYRNFEHMKHLRELEHRRVVAVGCSATAPQKRILNTLFSVIGARHHFSHLTELELVHLPESPSLHLSGLQDLSLGDIHLNRLAQCSFPALKVLRGGLVDEDGWFARNPGVKFDLPKLESMALSTSRFALLECFDRTKILTLTHDGHEDHEDLEDEMDQIRIWAAQGVEFKSVLWMGLWLCFENELAAFLDLMKIFPELKEILMAQHWIVPLEIRWELGLIGCRYDAYKGDHDDSLKPHLPVSFVDCLEDSVVDCKHIKMHVLRHGMVRAKRNLDAGDDEDDGDYESEDEEDYEGDE